MAGTVRAEVAQGPRLRQRHWPSVRWHTARVLGAALGTRADRLPAAVTRRLSLERRA